MARVTVEDCVDKVPNRFELILLAAHRARGISKGAPVSVDAQNDKNPVIALREVAAETIQAADMREALVHALQANVEVDEPELSAAPVQEHRPILGRDDPTMDVTVEVMTEDQLLRGLEKLKPIDPSFAQKLPSA